MAVQEIYLPHNFKTPSGTYVFSQLDSVSVNRRMSRVIERGASEVLPSFIATGDENPDLTFNTKDIKTWQTLIAAATAAVPGQLSLAAGFTGDAVLGMQKAAFNGTRVPAGNSSHMTVTIKHPVIYWNSIEASQGGRGNVSVVVKPIWDGSNEPVQTALSAALSGASAVNSVFTLGGVKVDGAWLTGCQRTSINSGIVMREEFSDGNLFPTACEIIEANPSVMIPTKTASYFHSNGKRLVFSTMTCFFTQYAQGGTQEVPAALKHVAVTLTDGVCFTDQLSGGQGSTVDLKFEIKGTITTQRDVAISL